ncbi:MAG: VWA domain-containing protein [Eubacteriales bacterium]|nr:VWA domain-containing protein [Eubacteriales bacterium]
MKNSKTILAACALLLMAIVSIGLLVLRQAPSQKLQRELASGHRYLEQADYDQAILAYEAAVEIDAKSPEAYVGLGSAYMQKAQKFDSDQETKIIKAYDRSISAFETVTTLKPEDADAYIHLGDACILQAETYISMNRSEDAAEAYKKASEAYLNAQEYDEDADVEAKYVYAENKTTALNGTSPASSTEAIAEDSGEIAPAEDNVQKAIGESEASDKSLSIEVQQVDISAFPVTRLYLDIEETTTHTVPKDLLQDFFIIEKKDANGTYIKQTVQKINQLNETEALMIDMVADISGSMDGRPIQDAKNVMSSFVNSVQFASGDQVELTTFATGVSIRREFTGDAGVLLNDIASLYTEDMTALFDALYTAVQRTAAQSGAKCVIAFTDGKDNYSAISASEVIACAQRYNIPIFIIGIGDVDTYELTQICSQTGGKYYSINEISSMESIYAEIYRAEKELYLVEFEDSTRLEMTDESDIHVYYRSNYYSGDTTYHYKPNILISASNDNVYKSGPESVVEKYIRGFATAMTTSDFANIEPYLLPGSNIYNTQRSYIQQNISERLDSCEIVSTVYNGNDRCIVTTRETYYVQKPGKHLELMTQECQYIVVQSGGTWYLQDFASNVNVLFRINA